MLNWLAGGDAKDAQQRKEPLMYKSVVSGLQSMYKKHLLALEREYKFHTFYSPLLTDGDFSSKPMVMLIGQYSTGKTTFIRHLLERDYPGLRIGPEPTTDKFVAVMHGSQEQLIPGNAAVIDPKQSFSQLSNFGNSFLMRFECAMLPSVVLEGLTLIDTPGVLSGNKQTSRGYDFEGVIHWFAERVDLILLIFDAHKLDISDEFRRCIQALRGNDTKIRILLNKADMVSNQQLMRVYGALMWSLGKVIPTPEVARVYIGSFWDQPLHNLENRALFEAESNDLYSGISKLPRNAALRKVNDFIKRVRLAKVHAYLLNYLRKQMPMFGRQAKQKALIQSLQEVYRMVSQEYSLPIGDFPDIETTQEKLRQLDFSAIPKLDYKRMEAIDAMIQVQIPNLMKLIPQEEQQAIMRLPTDGMIVSSHVSPFFALKGDSSLPMWAERRYLQTPPDQELFAREFEELNPDATGLISGLQAKEFMVRSNLPSSVLHRVWNLADITKDGFLDLYEYCLVRHFISMKLDGFELPASVPQALLPRSGDESDRRVEDNAVCRSVSQKLPAKAIKSEHLLSPARSESQGPPAKPTKDDNRTFEPVLV